MHPSNVNIKYSQFYLFELVRGTRTNKKLNRKRKRAGRGGEGWLRGRWGGCLKGKGGGAVKSLWQANHKQSLGRLWKGRSGVFELFTLLTNWQTHRPGRSLSLWAQNLHMLIWSLSSCLADRFKTMGNIMTGVGSTVGVSCYWVFGTQHHPSPIITNQNIQPSRGETHEYGRDYLCSCRHISFLTIAYPLGLFMLHVDIQFFSVLITNCLQQSERSFQWWHPYSLFLSPVSYTHTHTHIHTCTNSMAPSNKLHGSLFPQRSYNPTACWVISVQLIRRELTLFSNLLDSTVALQWTDHGPSGWPSGLQASSFPHLCLQLCSHFIFTSFLPSFSHNLYLSSLVSSFAHPYGCYFPLFRLLTICLFTKRQSQWPSQQTVYFITSQMKRSSERWRDRVWEIEKKQRNEGESPYKHVIPDIVTKFRKQFHTQFLSLSFHPLISLSFSLSLAFALYAC